MEVAVHWDRRGRVHLQGVEGRGLRRVACDPASMLVAQVGRDYHHHTTTTTLPHHHHHHHHHHPQHHHHSHHHHQVELGRIIAKAGWTRRQYAVCTKVYWDK